MKKSPELVSGIFQACSIVLVGEGGGGEMFELKVIFELPISLTIYFGLLKTPFRKKVASFLFVATSSRYDSIIFFRII